MTYTAEDSLPLLTPDSPYTIIKWGNEGLDANSSMFSVDMLSLYADVLLTKSTLLQPNPDKLP